MKKLFLGLLIVPCLAFGMEDEKFVTLIQNVCRAGTELRARKQIQQKIVSKVDEKLAGQIENMLGLNRGLFENPIMKNFVGNRITQGIMGKLKNSDPYKMFDSITVWVTGINGAQERAVHQGQEYKDFILNARNNAMLASVGLAELHNTNTACKAALPIANGTSPAHLSKDYGLIEADNDIGMTYWLK